VRSPSSPGFQGVHKAHNRGDDARARRLGHVGSLRSRRRSSADVRYLYEVDGPYTIRTTARRAEGAKVTKVELQRKMWKWDWLRSARRSCRGARSNWLMVNKVKALVRSACHDPAPPRLELFSLSADEEEIMERRFVTARFSRDEAADSLAGMSRKKPGVPPRILVPLADAQHQRRMLIQSSQTTRRRNRHHLTVTGGELQARESILEKRRSEDRLRQADTARRTLVKISAIGVGMRSHSGVADARISRRRERRASNIRAITTFGDQVIDADRRRLIRACGLRTLNTLLRWMRSNGCGQRRG